MNRESAKKQNELKQNEIRGVWRRIRMITEMEENSFVSSLIKTRKGQIL